MGINEACYHLANGKEMSVEGRIIRLCGGFYQFYSKEEDKWLFLEQNGISNYENAVWEFHLKEENI